MSSQLEKIKIQSIVEKGTARINEDCLVIQDNIFGVFDGATSLEKRTFGQGETGGRIASTTARSVFRKNHFPLSRLARQANREIMDQMVKNGVDVTRKENLWSTSAAVVRIKTDGLEWVQTGDAMIILVYENGSHKVLVDREDHDFETLTLWKELIKEQMDTDRENHQNTALNADDPKDVLSSARKSLAAQIRKVRMGMNIAYGVLNGEKEAEAFLNRGTESLNQVKHVLLFTDGLTLPCATVNKSRNYATLVKDFLSLGLEGLKTRIRETEKTDPFCLEFPRFKCHDDIAAIALSFQ